MEEAHSRRLFKLPVEDEQLDFRVTEVDIANTDRRLELEDNAGEAKEDVGNLVRGEDQNDVVILDQPIRGGCPGLYYCRCCSPLPMLLRLSSFLLLRPCHLWRVVLTYFCN